MLQEAHDIDSLIISMETVKPQASSLKLQFSGDFGPKRASARSQVLAVFSAGNNPSLAKARSGQFRKFDEIPHKFPKE
jgi:hypothetical protein